MHFVPLGTDWWNYRLGRFPEDVPAIIYLPENHQAFLTERKSNVIRVATHQTFLAERFVRTC